MLRRASLLLFLFLAVVAGLPLTAGAQTSASLNGFVVGTNLQGINGARVRIVSGPAVGREVNTTANGSYRIANLPTGTFSVVATANGFEEDRRGVTLTTGQAQRLDFTLRANTTTGGILEGRVTQRGGGLGISDARVEASDAFRTFSATTDEGGFYRFTQLPATVYRVSVTRVGYLSQQRSGITVRDGRTVTANFALNVRGADLARIDGRVLTDTGRAIRSAQVTLIRDGSTVISTRTGTSGNYALVNLVPDRYLLRVEASGFQAVETAEFDLTAGSRVRQDFTLVGETEPTASLQGTVTDDFGEVLGGVRVEITSGIDAGAFDVTDDQGEYLIEGLAAGRRTVTASAGGFNSRSVTLTLQDGEVRTQDFTLRSNGTQETGSITGRVTDQDTGEALRSVRVRVSAGPLTGRTTTTDSGGDYSLADLPAGTYSLTFTRSGYRSRTLTDVLVRASATTTLNAELGGSNADGRIFGRARNSENDVLEGVTVTLLLDGEEQGTAVTDESGDYDISDLPAGTYSARFEADGYADLELANLQLRDGASLRVNATLLGEDESNGSIAGVVRDLNGQPVEGATLELTGPSGVLTTQTAANGRFQFGNLLVGTGYRVTATADGLQSASVNATVRSGATTEVVLTMRTAAGFGNLGGTVRSAAGPLLPGAVVRIVSGRRVGETRAVGANGQFSFQGLQSGTYVIEASATGFRAQQRTVIIRGGASSFVNFFLMRQ